MGGLSSFTHCCWCQRPFVLVGRHYWCRTPACQQRQAAQSIAFQNRQTKEWHYEYVPLPKQVEYDTCHARNILGGGAAGSTKSYAARWGMYRRALAIPNYEALLLRRTWSELEKHHLRLMERETRIFESYGIPVVFSKTDREMRFPNGSVIEGGHMENPDDVEKYLSRERDDIVVDEGSTFQPQPLLELSTRARTTKSEVITAGGAHFRVLTNPGGPSAPMLRDFFIDHTPNFEDFPALGEWYDPADWVYIPGNLEDNPYLPESYQADLAVLPKWRYEQLRYNNWDIISGQFFQDFDPRLHVKDLGDPGDNVEWFRSMDWGYVSPGCVLWWACLPDEVYYIRYLYKFDHKTVQEVKDEVTSLTRSYGITTVRYTAADPAIWQAQQHGGESIAETFMRPPNPIPVLKAKNDRVNGWQRIHELLRVRPDGKPSLIIHPSCAYLIRTFQSAVSSKTNPDDMDTHGDDHALDSARYGAMSRPSPTRTRSITSPKTFNAARARLTAAQRFRTVRR